MLHGTGVRFPPPPPETHLRLIVGTCQLDAGATPKRQREPTDKARMSVFLMGATGIDQMFEAMTACRGWSVGLVKS
jgi:hypothetical protein